MEAGCVPFLRQHHSAGGASEAKNDQPNQDYWSAKNTHGISGNPKWLFQSLMPEGTQAGTAYSVRTTALHAIGGSTVDGRSAQGSRTNNAASPYAPDAGDKALDRYKQGVEVLTDVSSTVKGDVQADVDRLGIQAAREQRRPAPAEGEGGRTERRPAGPPGDWRQWTVTVPRRGGITVAGVRRGRFPRLPGGRCQSPSSR